MENWNLCSAESVAKENITEAPHLAPKAKDRIIQQCQSEFKRGFKRKISMFREESVQRMNEWIDNMCSLYTIE